MEVDEINDEIQEQKFKRILDLLSTSKTHVQNDCYLEKLLLKIVESGKILFCYCCEFQGHSCAFIIHHLQQIQICTKYPPSGFYLS